MSDSDKPVSVTFPSGHLANQILNAVVREKPINTSRRSQYPYYKKEYAMWLKASVDQMIASKAQALPLVFDYAIFCTVATNISDLTLYVRINQAARYLVDKMDDSKGTYAEWYEGTIISKDRKLGGVAITWKPELLPGTTLTPRLAEPVKEIPKWKMELNEWLESDKKAPFIRENLLLDKETIASLQKEYGEIAGLMISVSFTSIVFVKTL